MALVLADRVKETTIVVGTGAATLLGAASGYQSFSAGIGASNTTYYTIADQSGTNWEVGYGTLDATGLILTRTTVLSSSNSGSAVSFTTGTKDVWVDYTASKAVTTDTLAYPPAIGSTTPAAGTFTTITGQTEVLKGTGQNLIAQSQTFDNVGWTKSNSTITADSTTAPDGTTTADTLVENTANSTHYLYSGAVVGFYSVLVVGATYTISVYAKPAGRNRISFAGDGSTNYLGATSVFNISTGTVVSTGSGVTSASITSAGNGWYRCSITAVATGTVGRPIVFLDNGTTTTYTGDGASGVYLWGMQVEFGSTANTYLPTTTTQIYGTPTLSFSGVAGLGLQSDGSLYVSPTGTGALQAQATTSTTAGGNVRGANAVDWQTSRSAATQVASAAGGAVLAGGVNNTVSAFGAAVLGGGTNSSGGNYTPIVGGLSNASTGQFGFIGGGSTNTLGASQYPSIVCGYGNTAAGWFNFIGNGFTNSGTSAAAVTTQATTTVTSGSTAVTLSGSNASIKVGQQITGTGIVFPSYVAAISGTALTLSQNASATGTPTLSFYTPHGVVVGGGNNQATGSYSFIGGGGDAGTAANRNVASGDWSFVGGGIKNTASGNGAFIGGGNYGGGSHTGSGQNSFIGSGYANTASGSAASVIGGHDNNSNSSFSFIAGGAYGNTRGLNAYYVFPSSAPIASSSGVSQAALCVLGAQTTDATATILRIDGGAAGTTNQVILPNNSAYYFKVRVIAGVTGAGNTKAWTLEGAIKRGANAASTAIVGTVTTTIVAADVGAATWTVTATADTTNGGLAITVTGQAATTIRWVARAESTEMTF